MSRASSAETFRDPTGSSDNLPEGCSVEVPCLVDSGGIRPERIGAIEPHLAALMQTSINVQGLSG